MGPRRNGRPLLLGLGEESHLGSKGERDTQKGKGFRERLEVEPLLMGQTPGGGI